MRAHAPSLVAGTEANTGVKPPRFTKDGFDAFLDSGVLAHGFLRLRRGECGHAMQQGKAHLFEYDYTRDDAVPLLMQFKQRLLDPPFEVIRTESMAAGARRHDVLALMRSLKLHEM